MRSEERLLFGRWEVNVKMAKRVLSQYHVPIKDAAFVFGGTSLAILTEPAAEMSDEYSVLSVSYYLQQQTPV